MCVKLKIIIKAGYKGTIFIRYDLITTKKLKIRHEKYLKAGQPYYFWEIITFSHFLTVYLGLNLVCDMKKNTQLTLEKERLKLKIKQQEYEIKKSMLDLKEKYHPFNVALNVAGDFLTGRDNIGIENLPDKINNLTNKGRPDEVNGGLGALIAQIVGLLQNYFQFADTAAAQRATPPQEQYIIGEDDK